MNMKFFSLAVFVLVLKICSCQSDIKSIPNQPDWPGLTDANIEQYRELFNSIKGIGSGAVADLIGIITEFRSSYVVVIYLEKIVDDVLIKGLKADTNILTVSDVESYYSQFDPWIGSDSILMQMEEILSEKLTPEQNARAMTFIRGFQVGTTSEEIKLALDYLYGYTSSAPKMQTHIHLFMIWWLVISGKFLLW